MAVLHFEIAGNITEEVPKVKYLGQYINNDLADNDDDIKRQIRKLCVLGTVV